MAHQQTQTTPPEQKRSNQGLRRFLIGIVSGLAGMVALLTLKRRSAVKAEAAAPAEGGESATHRWGMVIDLDKCVGCGACVVACAVENNVMLGDPSLAEKRRVARWMQLLTFIEGTYPHLKTRLLPMLCFQCDNPPCTKVCPVRATYLNPEGLVAVVQKRCIGTRYCLNNCPYHIRWFNWFEPEFPEPLPKGLNPDVSVRTKGVVEKCTFCHHRLMKAKEQAKAEGRKLRPGDYVPACMEACPAQAIYFGDLNDPESEVSRLAHSRRAFVLLEDLGTRPKVFYLTEGS